jgi:hypothetical protein
MQFRAKLIVQSSRLAIEFPDEAQAAATYLGLEAASI